MHKLDVIKMGNPGLRGVSKEVDSKIIQSESFQQFLKNLIATMRIEDGAGIAAPQVAVMQRVFVMEMENNTRYPDKESFPLLIAINPKISPIGDELQDSWEGCLSIPNIRGKLKRYNRIKLTATDVTGKEFVTELTGFAAVVAQHELDHLDGILFIDRMESLETLTFFEEYQEYWADL
ncbi:peptide deformylase [Flavobacteriaceae bacterium R38]|nr:peptide deformylase [Flavobacteriaceae bacterium R38]